MKPHKETKPVEEESFDDDFDISGSIPQLSLPPLVSHTHGTSSNSPLSPIANTKPQSKASKNSKMPPTELVSKSPPLHSVSSSSSRTHSPSFSSTTTSATSSATSSQGSAASTSSNRSSNTSNTSSSSSSESSTSTSTTTTSSSVSSHSNLSLLHPTGPSGEDKDAPYDPTTSPSAAAGLDDTSKGRTEPEKRLKSPSGKESDKKSRRVKVSKLKIPNAFFSSKSRSSASSSIPPSPLSAAAAAAAKNGGKGAAEGGAEKGEDWERDFAKVMPKIITRLSGSRSPDSPSRIRGIRASLILLEEDDWGKDFSDSEAGTASPGNSLKPRTFQEDSEENKSSNNNNDKDIGNDADEEEEKKKKKKKKEEEEDDEESDEMEPVVEGFDTETENNRGKRKTLTKEDLEDYGDAFDASFNEECDLNSDKKRKRRSSKKKRKSGGAEEVTSIDATVEPSSMYATTTTTTTMTPTTRTGASSLTIIPVDADHDGEDKEEEEEEDWDADFGLATNDTSKGANSKPKLVPIVLDEGKLSSKIRGIRAVESKDKEDDWGDDFAAFDSAGEGASSGFTLKLRTNTNAGADAEVAFAAEALEKEDVMRVSEYPIARTPRSRPADPKSGLCGATIVLGSTGESESETRLRRRAEYAEVRQLIKQIEGFNPDAGKRENIPVWRPIKPGECIPPWLHVTEKGAATSTNAPGAATRRRTVECVMPPWRAGIAALGKGDFDSALRDFKKAKQCLEEADIFTKGADLALLEAVITLHMSYAAYRMADVFRQTDYLRKAEAIAQGIRNTDEEVGAHVSLLRAVLNYELASNLLKVNPQLSLGYAIKFMKYAVSKSVSGKATLWSYVAHACYLVGHLIVSDKALRKSCFSMGLRAARIIQDKDLIDSLTGALLRINTGGATGAAAAAVAAASGSGAGGAEADAKAAETAGRPILGHKKQKSSLSNFSAVFSRNSSFSSLSQSSYPESSDVSEPRMEDEEDWDTEFGIETSRVTISLNENENVCENVNHYHYSLISHSYSHSHSYRILNTVYIHLFRVRILIHIHIEFLIPFIFILYSYIHILHIFIL